MGTGTDVAMESAGVTLVKGDLRGILRARRLSFAGAAVEPSDHDQHPTEFILRIYLQFSWRTSRSGSSVPGLRDFAQPDHRQRSYEPELGVRHRQRPEAANYPNLVAGEQQDRDGLGCRAFRSLFLAHRKVYH